MPAAAVIPAPIAYIKIVAVETSVVEFHSETEYSCISLENFVSSGNLRKHFLNVTLSKLEGSSRVLCLNSSAWNNKLGFWSILLVTWIKIMVDKDVRGHSDLLERGEILRPSKDEQVRKHLSSTPVNQGRKLGDRRRLDTVVVPTINYAD